MCQENEISRKYAKILIREKQRQKLNLPNIRLKFFIKIAQKKHSYRNNKKIKNLQ